MSVTAYRLYPSSIPSAKSKKERHNFRCVFLLVGVSGFEPEASWTRTMRDTKLRHTPLNFIYYIDRFHFCQVFLFSFSAAENMRLPLDKKQSRI